MTKTTLTPLQQAIRKANRQRKNGGVVDPYMTGRRDALMELHTSGGLAEGRVGLEVLFLLPDSFVRFYADIFHRALIGAESKAVSGHGVGGGLGKAKGNTGTVLGSDSRLQEKGSGKKWKEPKNSLGSEQMLKVKYAVDRELLILVGLGTGKVDGGASVTKTCPGRCGRFVKATWSFCPTCGSGTGSRTGTKTGTK